MERLIKWANSRIRETFLDPTAYYNADSRSWIKGYRKALSEVIERANIFLRWK